MKTIVVVSLMMISASAYAGQNLNEAMNQNPRLAQAVTAVKAAARVECVADYNPMSIDRRGPDGLEAVTLQSACYDAAVFNPSQIGQLIVTYYGNGQTPASPVGDVIEVKFEVFK